MKATVLLLAILIACFGCASRYVAYRYNDPNRWEPNDPYVEHSKRATDFYQCKLIGFNVSTDRNRPGPDPLLAMIIVCMCMEYRGYTTFDSGSYWPDGGDDW